MSKVLIKNIKGLVQVRETPKEPLKGKGMAELPVLENAFLAIEDGRIVAYGSMKDWGGITDWRDLEVIDADGSYVLPGFVDSHTHLVFAASREEEFVDRIKGLTYQEIAEKGGGILNSARKLQKMSKEELFQAANQRLELLKRMGTTAIEIKSGYGLTVEAELKMLRVIKRLKQESDIPVKATFLGAHAFPPEFKDNHQGYIDLIVKEMIPAIKEEGLAEYIDAFCEKGYYSLEETEQVLEAGGASGLKPKVHVNQFNAFGGVELAVKYDALSVDHLEEMSDEDYKVLQNSNTIATSLPSCSFFLSIPYTPARKIIEKNIPLALATDFNPGSTPSGNMSFLLSLACIKQKLTPAEAINAVTVNGAFAIDVQDEVGSIDIGKRANLIITKPIESLEYLPYSFGENCIDQVLVNGKKLE